MNYYPFHIGDPFQTELLAAMQSRDTATTARERSRANARIRAIRIAAARAKGTHTDADWQALCEQLAHRCAMCGVYGSSVVLHKDHVTPIYQGGSDAIENLQPLCQPCNLAKGPDATNWAAYRLEHGFE
jgi:5-methylcytosine-specific restriction endonuclease McrA